MSAKKIVLSMLDQASDDSEAKRVQDALEAAGLSVQAGLWDRRERGGWVALSQALAEPSAFDAWVVAGKDAEFADAKTRYELSLIAANQLSRALPIVVVGLDKTPAAFSLPSLFSQAESFHIDVPRLGAKVLKQVLRDVELGTDEFRLSATVHPALGQWFEIGPREGHWNGVMFGVSDDATITHHGVGKRGELPERCTLEYAVQGMELKVGEITFFAWAVQNKIASDESYFVRVDDEPTSVVFGGHPGTDQAQASVLSLK